MSLYLISIYLNNNLKVFSLSSDFFISFIKWIYKYVIIKLIAFSYNLKNLLII